ncbi:hypothetical protein [Allomuricauda sp. F6463D]|uniref:hypothetical protein n=1 Tax=Allomuricauda sp. F6463D TaxID=2926409 RepID=UPI001FF593D7|nr:hypothetical protein [Muricauda sp. F6463D]MCK0160142.1 hypothetical protein [Muricauda sp. F6463D]
MRFTKITYDFKGTDYQGLEIFEVAGTLHYALLKLRLNKGELELIGALSSSVLRDLVPQMELKKALLLQINTTKVLNKQLDGDLPKLPEQWVKHAFPNLDLEQFYYQILDDSKLRMVSMAKRSVVEEHLVELKEMGIVPTGLSLGVSGLSPSISFLESPIRGSNFSFHVKVDGEFELSQQVPAADMETDIQGLRLPTTHLLSFSQILGHIQGSAPYSNLEDVNTEMDNHFKNQRFYQKGLQWGLGILLGVLLVNFLLFAHYRSKTMTSEGPIDPEQQARMLQNIQERVDTKENKLKALLGTSRSRTTYYMDRIGEGLPESILLDILAYQPLTRPVQPDKSIRTAGDQIRISGQTNNKEAFAEWTALLESMEWVGNLEIERYEYTSNTVDNFSIKIQCDAIGQAK